LLLLLAVADAFDKLKTGHAGKEDLVS